MGIMAAAPIEKFIIVRKLAAKIVVQSPIGVGLSSARTGAR